MMENETLILNASRVDLTPIRDPYSAAAGATIARIFFGGPKTEKAPELLAAARLMTQALPSAGGSAGPADVAYWYFGTLSMFQIGGTDWKAWNEPLKKTLLDSQKRKDCANGSWDPVCPQSRKMGRVWTTAMNVLSLEIYYRYGKVLKGKIAGRIPGAVGMGGFPILGPPRSTLDTWLFRFPFRKSRSTLDSLPTKN